MKKFAKGGVIKDDGIKDDVVKPLFYRDSFISRKRLKEMSVRKVRDINKFENGGSAKTDKDILPEMACLLKKGESWICRMCGEEYSNPLAHSCDFGPSAPVLIGNAAEYFLKKIKENENKKVPKEDYERAKKNYKKLK